MATFSRRGSFEIVEAILEACEQGARKTHIMSRANLSFDLLEKYLAFCHESSLLTRDAEGIIRPSAKGRRLLSHLRGARALLAKTAVKERLSLPPKPRDGLSGSTKK